MIKRFVNHISFSAVLLGTILLAGCGTNILFPNLSPEEAYKSANQHLKMASGAPPNEMLSHRLQAAELFIQAGEVYNAQRVLRETHINAQLTDPAIRRAILEARLSLLKKDYTNARNLLKNAVSGLLAEKTTSANTSIQTPTIAQHIALLLPSTGPHAEAAKIIRDGFLAAYYQTTKRAAPGTSQDPLQPIINDPSHLGLTVKIYDTGEGSKIYEAYEKALDENANFIVGPLTKPEVQAIAKIQLHVPVLALNTISGNPSSLLHRLYQFGIMPEDEVAAVAERALQQGRRNALILAPQNDWGKRLSLAFKDYWETRQGTIVDAQFFKSSQDLEAKIRSLLKVKQNPRRQDADMFFLAASPEIARQVRPLLDFYDAGNLPVYATASIYSGTPSPNEDQNLNGVQFCDMPWILQQNSHLQKIHDKMEKLWPNSIHRSPRFFALGMDAYLLATQLQKTQSLHSLDISGYTGELHLNNHQRIQRGLICAKFEQGVPMLD